MHVDERTVDCPYCGEAIVILVDGSAGEQSYVEDCQVCCRPIEITVVPDHDGALNVTARDENDVG